MSVPGGVVGAGLSPHVSSRTTVRASTKVSQAPAGPEAEPVRVAGGRIRARTPTTWLSSGPGGVWSLGIAELQRAQGSVGFSMGMRWVQIPTLPPVLPVCDPFLALGLETLESLWMVLGIHLDPGNPCRCFGVPSPLYCLSAHS